MKMVIPEVEPSEKMYKKEEIELKLEKINVFESEIKSIKTELIIINKRIKRLQDQKEDRK